MAAGPIGLLDRALGRPFLPSQWFQHSHSFARLSAGGCRGRSLLMHQKPNCKCAYCGALIHRRPDRLGIRNFCSTAHAGLARIERTIRYRAGGFAKLFQEYAKGFAKAHYKARSRATVRWRVLTFLEFLNTRGFSTIRAACEHDHRVPGMVSVKGHRQVAAS